MKTYQRIITIAVGVALSCATLFSTSCGETVGTHEMGPPGKGRIMSDAEMETRRGR